MGSGWHEWPLMIFTVFGQCVAGGFIVLALALLKGDLRAEAQQRVIACMFGLWVLMGIGFIVLFRHKASLGGLNILALYLQDKYGIRAGKFQMVVDACIVSASLFVVSVPMLLASVLGAVILNLIIAMNHRPGRYAV